MEKDILKQVALIFGRIIKQESLFSNFIQNAIQCNDDYGKINIIVENHNNDCVISVIDEGIGSASNFAEYIFEGFIVRISLGQEK